MLRTPGLLSGAAHDAYVCLERPSGALLPETLERARQAVPGDKDVRGLLAQLRAEMMVV